MAVHIHKKGLDPIHDYYTSVVTDEFGAVNLLRSEVYGIKVRMRGTVQIPYSFINPLLPYARHCFYLNL